VYIGEKQTTQWPK